MVKKETLSVPQAGPQGLVWMRKEVQEITANHKVKRLAYKRCETIRRPKDQRTWLEAVMMEAAYSTGVQDIRGFLKKQIAKSVGFGGKARYVAGLLKGTPFASEMGTDFEEPILVALAMMRA